MAISATSNLDVAGIVSQLMQIERRPMQSIERTLSGIQTQLSAWGKLQSALSTLQDSARTLARTETWKAASATSSDETHVKATSRSGAITGSYSIEVLALASRQTLATEQAWESADAVLGSGTLTVRVGPTADGSRETTVTIPPNATLAQVRDAINSADAGVTASLVADGAGQRLMLRSAETGAAQAFSVEVTDASGDLGALAYDLAADTGMSRTQTATDAKVKVNGLEVAATGNRLDGVIENVTLELKRETTAPIEIGVESDAKALRESIDTFVKAYNELNKLVADQTRYDPATKSTGPLQGNQSAVRVQQQMRELLRTTIGDGSFNSLNAIGLELQRDGSLSVKESKMSAALASPDKLQSFFAAIGAPPDEGGLAHRLVKRIGNLLDPEGTVPGAQESLKARQRSAEQQQERLEARLTEIQKRLMRQYTALDANLSRINGSFAGVEGLLRNMNNGQQ
ncbi:MAG: flagellar filament capping protein FliD [Burkholderiaceae bacterium]|jgi:flagellar hook-associated protein 2|nr:flagellar filament capping protein FliD [Burkholderiaceae bacterium]